MMSKQDILHNAVGAPPVAVAGMTLYGYGISDWVQVLAGVWLLLQIVWWVVQKMRPNKNEQEGRNDRGAGVASRDGSNDPR
jgi:hypothetical protein